MGSRSTAATSLRDLKVARRSKAESQRAHACRRASERYDLQLSDEKLASLVRQIMTGRAQFIEKQSNRVSIFQVDVEGRHAFVAYDKHRKSIITFLTHDMVKPTL
jgi:hypothetical protein